MKLVESKYTYDQHYHFFQVWQNINILFSENVINYLIHKVVKRKKKDPHVVGQKLNRMYIPPRAENVSMDV